MPGKPTLSNLNIARNEVICVAMVLLPSGICHVELESTIPSRWFLQPFVLCQFKKGEIDGQIAGSILDVGLESKPLCIRQIDVPLHKRSLHLRRSFEL